MIFKILLMSFPVILLIALKIGFLVFFILNMKKESQGFYSLSADRLPFFYQGPLFGPFLGLLVSPLLLIFLWAKNGKFVGQGQEARLVYTGKLWPLMVLLPLPFISGLFVFYTMFKGKFALEISNSSSKTFLLKDQSR